MAEGWNAIPGRNARFNSNSAQCRYFKRGNCMYGESCRFIHDMNTSQTTKSTPTPQGVKASSSSLQTAKTLPMPQTLKPLSLPSANLSTIQNLDGWVNAPEFVPSSLVSSIDSVGGNGGAEPGAIRSYAQALDPAAGTSVEVAQSVSELCPYFMVGFCRYAEECVYIHGELCELCNQYCLHPFDDRQRQQHTEECMRQHEADMEHSFAIARSREKSCGICMEVVWDKQPSEKQRFGLLPNCSHCFCLDCIRTWRQSKQFENKIIRSCPECRVQSDYVCPSRYWCETTEEKLKLIEDYKQALGKKPCKYFNQGRGDCPFGNKCFYLHALPDGTKADVGPPQRKNRRHRIALDDAAEEVEIVRLLVWDFLEERENRLYLHLGLDYDDLDDFLFTDSDSDYDY